MIDDLFAEAPRLDTEWLAPGAALLHGFALADEANILAAVHHIIDKAPFRHMMTSRGFRMSVAITNAGSLGWISDRSGYRYIAVDPESGLTWPPLPSSLTTLAQSAAALAGYPDFQPDACLINRYVPGARMSLHQDRDEKDLTHPIVSVSLGLPAVFQLGGFERRETYQRVPLMHGDVVVWGGESRLRFHGVLPLKAGHHSLLDEQRINLTFRRAG